MTISCLVYLDPLRKAFSEAILDPLFKLRPLHTVLSIIVLLTPACGLQRHPQVSRISSGKAAQFSWIGQHGTRLLVELFQLQHIILLKCKNHTLSQNASKTAEWHADRNRCSTNSTAGINAALLPLGDLLCVPSN